MHIPDHHIVVETNHLVNDSLLPQSSYSSTSAPKRLANGEIKSPKYDAPPSPTNSNSLEHLRNSSRASRASHIGEVSYQFRDIRQVLIGVLALRPA